VAVDVDPSPAAAIARAAGHGTPVVVAGSLFLAGEVRALAGRDVAQP
jgi:folylpolyglutamate synthase/dihydropteroate synthase